MKEFAPFLVLFAPLTIIVGMITRETCFFKHRKKKYVACDPTGMWIGQNNVMLHCEHPFAAHKYKARWVCEACNKMGEHCVKSWGDWTVQQGDLVPDVKKLANWWRR